MSPAQHSTPENDLSNSEDDRDPSGSKPGRKKNPNTQAARRDQNRIAQREFRLRKQQKIRDLEARVELLSGNRDETYNSMRDIMRSLMAENQQLRGLLQELGKFIGDGDGGPLSNSLSSVGWTLETFQAVVNRAETDTAFKTFRALKKPQQEANGTSPAASTADPGGRKRRRVDSTDTQSGGLDKSVSSTPQNAVAGPSATFPHGIHAPLSASKLSKIPPDQTPASYIAQRAIPPSPPLQVSNLPNLPPNYNPIVTSYLEPGQRLPNSNNPLPGLAGMGAGSSSAPFELLFPDEQGSADDASYMRKGEAGENFQSRKEHLIIFTRLAARLFKYHLDNFRRNSSYHLPKSLQPTLVQSTIPHEQIIDGIPFPELRDRLILLKDRFSLPEVCHALFTNTTLHGDDVLQHQNWELSKSWLERFPFLVDEKTLAIANKWRRERGDPEISMNELLKD